MANPWNGEGPSAPPLRVPSLCRPRGGADELLDLDPATNFFSREDLLFIDNVLSETHVHGEPAALNSTSVDSGDISHLDVEDKAMRRKIQNRLSSARFRAKQKAREKEVGLLRDQVAELEQEVKRLESLVFTLESQLLVTEEAAQQTTIEWVLSKFRLRRKVKFITYSRTVKAWIDLWESVKSR